MHINEAIAEQNKRDGLIDPNYFAETFNNLPEPDYDITRFKQFALSTPRQTKFTEIV